MEDGMGKYDILGTPFKIGHTNIKNRFCMAPLGGASIFVRKADIRMRLSSITLRGQKADLA